MTHRLFVKSRVVVKLPCLQALDIITVYNIFHVCHYVKETLFYYRFVILLLCVCVRVYRSDGNERIPFYSICLVIYEP